MAGFIIPSDRRAVTTRASRKAHWAAKARLANVYVTLCGRWFPTPIFLDKDHNLEFCSGCAQEAARHDRMANRNR